MRRMTCGLVVSATLALGAIPPSTATADHKYCSPQTESKIERHIRNWESKLRGDEQRREYLEQNGRSTAQVKRHEGTARYEIKHFTENLEKFYAKCS